MSKFKIEHGASKTNFVVLKTNIEDTISSDIDRMAEWSNNDRKYIVNELLRFAIAQEEDFLKFKAGTTSQPQRSKPVSVPAKPATDPASKTESTHAS